MTEAPGPRRGRKPRFSQEQLVDAAVAMVDEQGFGQLSLSGLARRLGVTPMAMYTYVASSEELALLVVERIILTTTSSVTWPEQWQEALRVFTRGLSEMLHEHPAMTEAYGQGVVHSDLALRVAETVLSRLLSAGMGEHLATEAYAAVHALVIGTAVLHRGTGQALPREPLEPAAFPALLVCQSAVGRLGDLPVEPLLELLIAGIESRLDEDVRRRTPAGARPASRSAAPANPPATAAARRGRGAR
jgi:TetR/AcrR family tetracycline transcriptional repressor